MRLANRVRALPNARQAEPQAEAVEAAQFLSAAIRKHGPKPKLLQSLSLVEEFLGRYSEAYDLARRSSMRPTDIARINGKRKVAECLRDRLWPDEALLVEPLRTNKGSSAWAVVIGRAFLQRDDIYTAEYRENKNTKQFDEDVWHNPEARSGYQLAVYEDRNGSLHQMAEIEIADVVDRLSETALYAKDLDNDGDEEAIVSCEYYGADWLPTTYSVAGMHGDKWFIDETDTYESPAVVEDADKDGSFEIVGPQNMGDLGHASQPRYPVAYRWQGGKLVNADRHIKPLLRAFLKECEAAELVSKNDIEVLGCKARALRVLGRNKEARANYHRAAKLNKAWAKRLWDGMPPYEAQDRSR